jgi:rRNA-processing protein FCF1
MRARPIYSTDTNIWIQLYHGEIVERVFNLPFQFISTDLVIGEVEFPDGAKLVTALRSKGLVEYGLDGKQIAEVERLTIKHKQKRISPVDMSALVLARDMGVILLTGDNGLRRAALEERIKQVHGMLWLLDEIVSGKVLKPREAADALEKMLKLGAWLPRHECEERIRRWKAIVK